MTIDKSCALRAREPISEDGHNGIPYGERAASCIVEGAQVPSRVDRQDVRKQNEDESSALRTRCMHQLTAVQLHSAAVVPPPPPPAVDSDNDANSVRQNRDSATPKQARLSEILN